jgi:hypothetical protein
LFIIRGKIKAATFCLPFLTHLTFFKLSFDMVGYEPCVTMIGFELHLLHHTCLLHLLNFFYHTRLVSLHPSSNWHSGELHDA